MGCDDRVDSQQRARRFRLIEPVDEPQIHRDVVRVSDMTDLRKRGNCGNRHDERRCNGGNRRNPAGIHTRAN